VKEQEILQNLKSGQSGIFRKLVEHFQGKVINTCFGFVQNIEDAEDIAQEVFIEVYRSINTFKEEAKLSTWIYRIATNKSLDFIRKRNRKKRFAESKRIIGIDNPVENIVTDDYKHPQKELENTERIKILHQAINTLPENQKISFTLSKYEGLSNKEIADILNTSISSVESLMFRAKKKT